MRSSLPTLALMLALTALPATGAEPSSVTLNRYTSTDRSYGANAYWLESQEGIVLIDALFLKPDAELLATIIASRHKPLAGVILTHPHVDHFGGLGVLRSRFPDVPIYATRATAAAVKPTHDAAYTAGWIQAFGADYDPNVVVPDRVVESGTEITLAGMRFTVTSFGAMESADNAVVYSADLGVLFAGDALVNGAVYYLGEGHSAGAIDGLQRLAGAYPKATVAIPGHGDPGDLQQIVEENLAQVRGLRREFEAAVARPNAIDEKGALRDVVRARLVGTFVERLRGKLAYGLTVDMIARMNLGGLESELLADSKKNS